MSIAGPSFSQIKAQVASIRDKVPGTTAIAISSRGRWTGQQFKKNGDQTYMVCQCDSPLAMRLALRDRPANATAVLVTGLDDAEVDDDLRVRLAKRRVIPLDNWQIVRSLFEAQQIDPRIIRLPWMAEELMELRPAEGYAPTAGGFLDAERAWSIVLRGRYGMPGGRPDLTAILLWSTEADNVAKWKSAADDRRAAAVEWLAQVIGPAARTILDCVSRTSETDTVPLGLAMGVVFAPEAEGHLEKARGRMEERYFAGDAPPKPIRNLWCRAASALVRDQLANPRLKRSLLARGDDILEEVGATDHAYLSEVSPLGFEQRFARFGQQLNAALDNEQLSSLTLLLEPRMTVLDHALASVDRQQRRVERMDMAVRLVRWLKWCHESGGGEASSLTEAADRQVKEDGYVDWARWSLRTGDSDQSVSRAYHRLFERIRLAREAQARAFAKLLRDWTRAGGSDAGVLPIESVLSRIVAPLAERAPVLVVVLDGMSVAVWRELMDDLIGYDWTSLVPVDQVSLPPVVATVPSVTEVSRASLLCGRLSRGTATDEKKGFAEHAELVQKSRAGSPPVLFHKAALHESDEVVLEGDLRHEIGSAHRRFVGVVVNAVDDHLLKGEQLDVRWSRDAIRVLPVLLHEARTAGRVVVLLSDHGHILDYATQAKSYPESGERWRADDDSVQEHELRVQGERVVAGEQHTLIAPWSETLRYGMKKNGYHGGLNPQEMVVPVAVLSSSVTGLKGWDEAPVQVPSWWDDSVPSPVTTPIVPAQKEEMEEVPPSLFAQEETRATAAIESDERRALEAPDWVDAMLASPVFTEQKKMGGRAVPDDAVFAKLLVSLDQRGGKMTTTALARAVDRPPHRLAGLLAVAQRVLNIDGYAVLSRDDASDTVKLNVDLLRRQFGLD